ncbi:ATP-binding cassette subfamily B multidrug efflux pump [Rhodothalassium salexigens DSM 2132]|uniref:ATP-binding cassette subfamily B multidrug efflux pump n=1 Tax=Rhodothalassium salexigens DSM 2132 TaxID=1188247 RepID=A0A4R2PBT1_RHOSA|nr:ABC transporter ATP-binding protein [Rhodothalassium salexigens]MBB4212256.1 ATP-binding cassette subfamily B multidrug efflux pump [Rhodothalassium salexigens DSM 2132]MBK1639043.1 multidrug ABC transporter ATP-binding protein [Rhodothalassium salexigens DSM 2132]TCP32593.1 ATP-binding cassette subfamily B multidrug efflux pump [Rhodothalassium salexigens DSM 2132]
MLRWFETRLEAFPSDPAEQPPRGLWAYCWHYARSAKGLIGAMAATSAAVAILEVWLFAVLGQLVDWLDGADRATFLAEYGWTLVGMSVVVLVVLPAMALLSGLVVHQGLLGPFPMRIRWLTHKYLLGQSLSFFQDDFAGRIATKLMQTSLAVREVVLKLTDVLLYVGVYFLGTLALLGGSDWRLMVPMVLWFLGYVAMMRFFLPRLQDRSERQADARADMTGRVVDSYANVQTVKLFARSGREERYARDGMDGFLATVFAQMRLVTGLQTCLYTLNSLLVFGVAGLSIHLWLTQAVSLGEIAVAISIVLRQSGMAQWIMWEISALFENIGTIRDGIATFARPRAIVDRPDARALTVTRGAIRYDGVAFHYGKGSGVIDDLTLEIGAGERVGLIGRSGAGKSTLVNLLLRFHDVEAGRILIDGQDIAAVTQESLRRSIGMVTQEPGLLNRSVRDNIRFGSPEACDTAVWRAAERAHAAEFITGLVDHKGRTGLDAHVGDRGVKLSGGQRQRIAIARMFLKDAPVLLLDEATSALDSEVEAAIQDSLAELMAGKTVIAIAHRLSTIASMDRLIVLDRGRIVEQGTHDDLLRAGGLYARLWQRQSGGFLTEEAAAE